MKTALITGITGQDGSYLAEFLLTQGYKVYGMVRRASVERFDRILQIQDKVHLVQGDLADQSSLDEAIKQVQPDEVYNLGSQSFVPTSWNQPVLTGDVTGLGVTRILEAIRKHRPQARTYQASSSEMYGHVKVAPQDESTSFHPRSPYAVAKVYGHYITVNYRESYNLFACSGICFNHESPRRGLEFVSRKVTSAVAAIKLGRQKKLSLGNLESKRDWGFAGDYVKAMWQMLQRDAPADYVVATGEAHSVRELVELAFDCAGLSWHDYVVFDQKLLRPAEVNALVGNATKAKRELGWTPEVSFHRLIEMMVEHDLQLLSGGRHAR